MNQRFSANFLIPFRRQSFIWGISRGRDLKFLVISIMLRDWKVKTGNRSSRVGLKNSFYIVVCHITGKWVSGSRRIWPRRDDLGFFHWRTGKTMSRDSLNYKVSEQTCDIESRIDLIWAKVNFSKSHHKQILIFVEFELAVLKNWDQTRSNLVCKKILFSSKVV